MTSRGSRAGVTILVAVLSATAGGACDGGPGPIERPGVPALQEPIDGSEQQNALELRWAEVPGAVRYQVQIARDGLFGEVGLDAREVESTRMVVNDLEVGATYFWRLRAINEAGDGGWTEPWHFEVTAEAPMPGEVRLSWPPDGSGYMEKDLFLRWEPADGATMYHVQVSQEPVFLRLDAELRSVVGEAQEIGNLDSTYTYFWRVRSRNLAGYGPWSPTWSFVVLAAEGWVPGT